MQTQCSQFNSSRHSNFDIRHFFEGGFFYLLDFGSKSGTVIDVPHGGIHPWKGETPGTRVVSYQSLG